MYRARSRRTLRRYPYTPKRPKTFGDLRLSSGSPHPSRPADLDGPFRRASERPKMALRKNAPCPLGLICMYGEPVREVGFATAGLMKCGNDPHFLVRFAQSKPLMFILAPLSAATELTCTFGCPTCSRLSEAASTKQNISKQYQYKVH